MVDLAQDVFSFIIDDCKCSSSQEELLSHAQFARQDETLSGNEQIPSPVPVVEASCDNPNTMEGVELDRRFNGELVNGVEDIARVENLGFRGEIEGELSEMKGEGDCGNEIEIEPKLKKTRVIPTIHCSGKVVIEGGDDGEKMVAFSGDLNVEVESSSQSFVVLEGGGCTEKIDTEGVEDDVRVGVDVELKGECGLKNDLDTEVIDLEEEEIEEKGNDNKDKSEDRVEGDGKVGDGARGEEEGGGTRMKRELPPSMFGLVWGEVSGDGKRNESSKAIEDDGLKCILKVLRVLASEECSDENNEVDIFETAKRRGMTFPHSRFLVELEEDE